MKLRIVSDLHVEFHRDGGFSLLQEIVSAAFDVLVVAGDLCSAKGLYAALRVVCEAADRKPVVYVMGNHEGYGRSWKAAFDEVSRAAADFPNLVFLENALKIIDGVKFVGCTLWCPHPGEPLDTDGFIGDYRYISDIYENVMAERWKTSRAFLLREVGEGCVVITHHLPHPRSVAAQYEGHILNRYFLHDVSAVVERGGAQLWIHGHTHTSMDYVVGTTRVVCNPFGYAAHQPGEPNRKFNPSLTVSVLSTGE